MTERQVNVYVCVAVIGGGEYSGGSGSGASGYGHLDSADTTSPLSGAAAAADWTDPASSSASYQWQSNDPGASYIPYNSTTSQGAILN